MSSVSTISQPAPQELIQIVMTIKSAILRSRYIAAKSVNRHALALYYHVGEYIDHTLSEANWGDSTINQISNLLQQELPGLSGFAPSSIRKMRSFYKEWRDVFEICSLSTNKFIDAIKNISNNDLEICSLSTNKLTADEYEAFMSIGFSHHYEIVVRHLPLEDRIFYIKKCAIEFWTVNRLKIHLKEKLHESVHIKAHSFEKTITDNNLKSKALRAFKDEYLLNLINLEDYDPDEIDEKILEYEIVHNIKTFIMAFGQDFTFMGNQYRLEVDGEELFIDLLFYHRTLRCLVAVELKRGKFKGAYAGQLNVYLSALDDLIRHPDENPSIGLILCREKSDKMVEYAFRDMSKPMGVATYKLMSELPRQYSQVLPKPDDLRKLLNKHTEDKLDI